MVGARVAEGHLQLVGHRHPRDGEPLVVARALAPDHRAQRLAVLTLPRLVRARARARARVKVRVRVRVRARVRVRVRVRVQVRIGFGLGSRCRASAICSASFLSAQPRMRHMVLSSVPQPLNAFLRR